MARVFLCLSRWRRGTWVRSIRGSPRPDRWRRCLVRKFASIGKRRWSPEPWLRRWRWVAGRRGRCWPSCGSSTLSASWRRSWRRSPPGCCSTAGVLRTKSASRGRTWRGWWRCPGLCLTRGRFVGLFLLNVHLNKVRVLLNLILGDTHSQQFF